MIELNIKVAFLTPFDDTSFNVIGNSVIVTTHATVTESKKAINNSTTNLTTVLGTS